MTEASLKPTGDAASTGVAAAAAFASADVAASAGDRGLAILGDDGRLLHAAPGALEAFRAADAAQLSRILTGGHGPTARRLRHMARTLPVGAPARLERLRFLNGRDSIVLNLRCARILGAAGEPLLILFAPSAEPSGKSAATVPDAPIARSEPKAVGGARFLWALDEAGRFGAEDSALVAALGESAPRQGETLESLGKRSGAESADAWVSAVARRETFSDLLVAWPAAGAGFRVRMRLSGAPRFGRVREFQGFRGFGVIEGDPYPAAETAGAPEMRDAGATPPEQAADATVAQAPLLGPDANGSETPPGLLESADAEPIDLAPEIAGEGPEPAAPRADGEGAVETPKDPPQERTAAIYILRQTAPPGSSRVVPIRPGAPEETPPPGPASDSESIELSKSERDAFREIARALVGRTPASRADRFLAPEPSPAPAAEVSAAPAADVPPSPPGLSGDGPERNAAAILDKLPVGVLVAREGRPIYLNQTLLTLLGYDDLAHFERTDGFAAMFGGADPEAMPAEAAHALTIERADGEPVAIDAHAQATVWDGAPATLIAFRRSGEDRRRENAGETGALAAGNGSADELQVMLDLATDGAATLDSAGRILTLNASGERLFGYAEKEVAGESVLMLLAPQSHPETTARLDRLSGSADFAPPHPLTVTGRRRDGTAVTLALTLARLGSGEALHYCALLRNLGPERVAERRLASARDAALAASAAKTDFLAQVSHEIRTPLHAILGFAEVMLEERFGPIGNARYKDYLSDIHTSGRHVVSLADDLLDLAKIEAGKLELAFTQVDANAVIRECVSLMQPQAARERIIMRVSLADHMPWVMVDERSLRQIMLNLMSNAVKFNEPGGQVIVSTAVDEGGQAVIRVRDTGVGMSESEIGHALEPFGQIGRRNKSGAGLGLPLTKALVEANRAEFSIKSQRERGTLIEIAFPVAHAAQ